MAHQPNLSRRKALSFFASAPLLPLASSASVAAMLSACGGSSTVSNGGSSGGVTPPAQYTGTTFTASGAPSLASPAAMATTTVTSALNVQFSDNSSASYKLSYQPFFITGDMVDDGKGGKVLTGGYVDIRNQPIMAARCPARSASSSPTHRMAPR